MWVGITGTESGSEPSSTTRKTSGSSRYGRTRRTPVRFVRSFMFPPWTELLPVTGTHSESFSGPSHSLRHTRSNESVVNVRDQIGDLGFLPLT